MNGTTAAVAEAAETGAGEVRQGPPPRGPTALARARDALRRLPIDTVSRPARWLAGLLGVQLAVTLALVLGGRDGGAFAPDGPLLAFDAVEVERLRIADGTAENAESVTLVREGDGWRLDGEPALAADVARAEALLAALGALEADLPVASAQESRAQLDVADDDFQRRVTLEGAEGGLAELYVGTSPGFRLAHVRLAGEDAIRALGLAVHELPATADAWLDAGLLAIEDPVRIEGEGFALVRDGEAWSLEGGAPEGRALSAERARELADAVSGLRVTGVADADAADGMGAVPDDGTGEDAETEGPDAGSADPLALRVTGADGTVRAFAVTGTTGDGATISRDDVDAMFALPAATRDRLVSLASLDALLVDTPAVDGDGTDGEGDTEPAPAGADADSPQG